LRKLIWKLVGRLMRGDSSSR